MMTGAEFRTLRDALGLNVDTCCRLFAVADRTVRRWDTGRLPVPEGVARQLLQLDASFDEGAAQSVSMLDHLLEETPVPPGIEPQLTLVRYRTDADLARYHPDLGRLGTLSHGMIIDRAARLIRARYGWAPRIVWLDPESYDAWRGRRPDSEALRAAWAAEHLDAPPPAPPAADS